MMIEALEKACQTRVDENTSSYTESTSESVVATLTFTGRRSDPEAELMYFRNRYYSPELGRFVSRDAVGYGDGMSLYNAYFVPGMLDPLGLQEIPPNPCVEWDRAKCEWVPNTDLIEAHTTNFKSARERAYREIGESLASLELAYKLKKAEITRKETAALKKCESIASQSNPLYHELVYFCQKAASAAAGAQKGAALLVYTAGKVGLFAALSELIAEAKAENYCRKGGNYVSP